MFYTGIYLNDDAWHTFNLRRRADHLELWVDSQRHQTGKIRENRLSSSTCYCLTCVHNLVVLSEELYLILRNVFSFPLIMSIFICHFNRENIRPGFLHPLRQDLLRIPL